MREEKVLQFYNIAQVFLLTIYQWGKSYETTVVGQILQNNLQILRNILHLRPVQKIVRKVKKSSSKKSYLCSGDLEILI